MLRARKWLSFSSLFLLYDVFPIIECISCSSSLVSWLSSSQARKQFNQCALPQAGHTVVSQPTAFTINPWLLFLTITSSIRKPTLSFSSSAFHVSPHQLFHVSFMHSQCLKIAKQDSVWFWFSVIGVFKGLGLVGRQAAYGAGVNSIYVLLLF